jgi:predicted RNase H-like nuclease (RuvC/YqgF family)
MENGSTERPEQVRKIERHVADVEAEQSRLEKENEAAKEKRERLRNAIETDRWKGGDLPPDLSEESE